ASGGGELPQVGVAPPAAGQLLSAALPGDFPHVAALVADLAPDLHVGAEVPTPVVHPQPGGGALRAGTALVDEPHVREVVQVTGGAGEYEPGRHRQRPAAGLLL